MKKLIPILLIVLLMTALCFPVHAADQYELLENGDFESKSYFAWFPYYLSSLDYVADAHQGSTALKVTNRQHYTDVAGQYITEKLNYYGPGTYQISAYVRLADQGAQPVNLQIAIGYHTAEKQAWATSNYAQITADQWTLITAQVNLQWSGELGKAEFYFITDQNQEGTDYRNFLIDDCSMKTVTYTGEPYTPPTTEELTTEPPTQEPTTPEPTTEAPTQAPATEQETELVTEQPESELQGTEPDEVQSDAGGQISPSTKIISGIMFAAGIILLICGIVLITMFSIILTKSKRKEDVS